MPRVTKKIARAIEARDEAQAEWTQMHEEVQRLKYENDNFAAREQGRRKRDEKTITKLRQQVQQSDMAMKSLQEKYDIREEQLHHYLYVKVNEHESVGFDEPLPKLIEKLQHYEPLPTKGDE